MPLHVDYTLSISELPKDCIIDCSRPGKADEAVEFWQAELGFTVNRARAIDCLTGYGAWEREELERMSDESIAQKILWLACGDFSEFATHAERAGFDAFTGDRPDGFDPSSGSDIYVLEG